MQIAICLNRSNTTKSCIVWHRWLGAIRLSLDFKSLGNWWRGIRTILLVNWRKMLRRRLFLGWLLVFGLSILFALRLNAILTLIFLRWLWLWLNFHGLLLLLLLIAKILLICQLCLADSSLIFLINVVLSVNLVNDILKFTCSIIKIAVEDLVPLFLLLLLCLCLQGIIIS